MSLVDNFIESLGTKVLSSKGFKDVHSVTVAKEHLIDSVQAAKALGFNMLSDIFGIDYLNYPDHQDKRFAIAYNLYSVSQNERIFIRVALAEGEILPTITHIWQAANFMEREVYEMFGVTFEGHPNLLRLITPDEMEGYPHRKDFPLGETPYSF